MARIRGPADLPELVKAAFTKARNDGELNYYPTQATILYANHIPFQLRYSPALAAKPKGPPRDPSKPHKPFNPFENPPAALRITDVGPSHILVLNKFAVVPEHFILVTKDFKPQTHVLEESDLASTLACIQAYEEAKNNRPQEDGLFGFFNCGEHSGASQPHRHIQLLPIARMRDGLDDQAAWSVLADNLKMHKPPFATFSEDIHLDMSSKDLRDAYLRLYGRACRAVAVSAGSADSNVEPPAEGQTLISYNMAMTANTLVLCPRLAEGAQIVDHDGKVVGTLALNGTLLAGTALVKNELEWNTLREDENTLLTVLKGVGIAQD